MNLAKYRKAAGLTQSELGKIMGISNRKTVGAWEANPGNMTLDRLIAYAQACGVTVADLMGFDGEAQEKLDKVKSVVSYYPDDAVPGSGFDLRWKVIDKG